MCVDWCVELYLQESQSERKVIHALQLLLRVQKQCAEAWGMTGELK
jgi:hypothetical protein